MILKYATNLASQYGIILSKARFIEGQSVGCPDVNLLQLSVNEHLVSLLVYQSDLDALQSESCCEQLDKKLHTALSRLQGLLKS
jgi:hypothetical protein